jgi:hypothetical protein
MGRQQVGRVRCSQQEQQQLLRLLLQLLLPLRVLLVWAL